MDRCCVSLRRNCKQIRIVDVIGVLVIALVASAAFYDNASRQSEVTEALAKVGARSYRNGRNAIYSVVIVNKRLAGGDVLEKLPRLRDIESLSLSRSTFRGYQLAHLSDLRSLRSLALYDTDVGDRELTHIGGCRRLEVLSLDGTKVTSWGLESLSELDDLKYLSLARTRVDDDCVELLAELPALTGIDLRRTNVTYAGIRRLQSRKPSCQISFDRLRPA